ncbi:hypothetical protein VUR80DRAFT_972 [Thermomyces stellatus]
MSTLLGDPATSVLGRVVLAGSQPPTAHLTGEGRWASRVFPSSNIAQDQSPAHARKDRNAEKDCRSPSIYRTIHENSNAFWEREDRQGLASLRRLPPKAAEAHPKQLIPHPEFGMFLVVWEWDMASSEFFEDRSRKNGLSSLCAKLLIPGRAHGWNDDFYSSLNFSPVNLEIENST